MLIYRCIIRQFCFAGGISLTSSLLIDDAGMMKDLEADVMPM